jgi:hypothetical protein
MKQVFKLIVKIEDIDVDLYFEDQKTADKTVEFLNKLLTDEAKEKIKYEAEIHEVFSKETAMEQILMGLGMTNPDEIN